MQAAKSRTSGTICIDEDSDESLYENDSDSENDEAPLRNVLLVTGPVGVCSSLIDISHVNSLKLQIYSRFSTIQCLISGSRHF